MYGDVYFYGLVSVASVGLVEFLELTLLLDFSELSLSSPGVLQCTEVTGLRLTAAGEWRGVVADVTVTPGGGGATGDTRGWYGLGVFRTRSLPPPMARSLAGAVRPDEGGGGGGVEERLAVNDS